MRNSSDRVLESPVTVGVNIATKFPNGKPDIPHPLIVIVKASMHCQESVRLSKTSLHALLPGMAMQLVNIILRVCLLAVLASWMGV